MKFKTPAIIATDPRFIRHRYSVLIVLVILVAMVIVGFSLWLYRISGAAQLDLSRPGYQSIRSKTNEEEFKMFPSSGQLDKNSLDEFEQRYNQRAKQLTGTNAFSGDVLSDEALSFEVESASDQAPVQPE